MTTFDMRRVRSSTYKLALFFFVPNIIFSLIAVLTAAAPFISILNIVVIALSVNVSIAFVPNVYDVIFGDRPVDRGDLLTLGIFCAWFSIALGTALALAWRYLGQPQWLVDTDFNSYRNFMLACAAVFHLAAPGSIHESVPPRRWIRIGAWIAGAVFLAMVLIYASDFQAEVRARVERHDVAPGPLRFIVPL